MTRLLESGDDRLLEDGSSFRLLEEIIVTLLGGVARWRDPSPVSWREPGVSSWREPRPRSAA